MLRSKRLEVDEALLTGEAEPVARPPGGQVLSGSFVVAVTGRARAAAVGGEVIPWLLLQQHRETSLETPATWITSSQAIVLPPACSQPDGYDDKRGPDQADHNADGQQLAR